LEGSIVNVPPQGGRKHPEQRMIAVDTKNILFICGGAFEGIDRIIAKRLNTQVVGYGAHKKSEQIDKNNLLQYVLPDDLRKFGLIPEIVGRLPVLAYLNPLDRTALRRILIEPKNSIIKQYIKLFKMDNIKLSFTDDALDFIVDQAVNFKLGARGLRAICESIMLEAMFEMPSKKLEEFVVDKEYAQQKMNINSVLKFKNAG
jgi:ATP-dependent Clp protease ATP-binding subunit ClpX